jgi:hypothetical protein
MTESTPMTSKTDDLAWTPAMLNGELEDQAEWRRRNATEYPDDRRNLDSAEEYKRLARTVKDIPKDLLVAYSESFDEEDDTSNAESYLVRSLRRTLDANDVPSDVAEKVIRLIVDWEKASRDDKRRDD